MGAFALLSAPRMADLPHVRGNTKRPKWHSFDLAPQTMNPFMPIPCSFSLFLSFFLSLPPFCSVLSEYGAARGASDLHRASAPPFFGFTPMRRMEAAGHIGVDTLVSLCYFRFESSRFLFISGYRLMLK